MYTCFHHLFQVVELEGPVIPDTALDGARVEQAGGTACKEATGGGGGGGAGAGAADGNAT